MMAPSEREIETAQARIAAAYDPAALQAAGTRLMSVLAELFH